MRPLPLLSLLPPPSSSPPAGSGESEGEIHWDRGDKDNDSPPSTPRHAEVHIATPLYYITLFITILCIVLPCMRTKFNNHVTSSPSHVTSSPSHVISCDFLPQSCAIMWQPPHRDRSKALEQRLGHLDAHSSLRRDLSVMRQGVKIESTSMARNKLLMNFNWWAIIATLHEL